MSQRRYRELRKIEESYPDAIEEVMDCRGDIMEMKDSDPNNGLYWSTVGFVLGIVAGIYASK